MNHEAVLQYFIGLRDSICSKLESFDKPFARDHWERPGDEPRLNGYGEVRMLEGGAVFERGGIALSNVRGKALPASGSEKHKHLAGKPFVALGVSLVMHPRNPFVPTTHMNVRYFSTTSGDNDAWWFGGGFDLTPYYPFEEDARAWHEQARAASGELYPSLKRACDEYFYLKHRGETRGIGGIFADDLTGDFDKQFALTQSIGNHFLPAYVPILQKRKDHAFSDRHRAFQAYRRGRYVEFNLVFDRGTSFGLQTGGRTEAILLSMPPHATWRYEWKPEEGTEEAKLGEYLKPREWF